MSIRLFVSGVAMAALVACGSGGTAANSASNAVAPASSGGANATVPANTAAAQSNGMATASARPVMTDGQAGEDACVGVSRVRAGATAVLRDGPAEGAREIERLAAGRMVRVCDDESVSGWAGVVPYSQSGELPAACEMLSTPSAAPVAIPASCRSGWVRAADTEPVAG